MIRDRIYESAEPLNINTVRFFWDKLNRKILIVQKIAGHHFSRPKIRQGIHFCHPKLPQIARWRAVGAFSEDIDLKQPTARSCMH